MGIVLSTLLMQHYFLNRERWVELAIKNTVAQSAKLQVTNLDNIDVYINNKRAKINQIKNIGK